MDPLYAHVKEFLTENLDYFGSISWGFVKIVILFIIIKITMSVLNRVIRRSLEHQKKIDKRRKDTLLSMMNNFIRIVFYAIFILAILPIFGIDIKALLAGAGVAGIAVAFGAQSLLRDYFNGFFIFFEDQFGVGDFVVINDNWGEIYAVTLRITALQIWTGEMVFIPNGEISQVTNYSKENALAVIDVEVGYKTEAEDASSIIANVLHNLREENEDLVGDVENLGVQSLNTSTYTLRATAECNPLTHWEIQRLAKARILEEFRRQSIDFPMEKVVYRHDQQPEQEIRKKDET